KELGLDPPPLAVAGQEFRVGATGVENLRAGFRVCAYDTGEAVPTRGLEWVDRGARTAAATVVLPSPGLYEIRLGTTPQIRELIGVVAADG
ncbi:MAG: hypothetical protein LBS27_12160, partial [Bifidobacteriaceae bacterium]|nr:hypothetical protein [Bifidobacteriaceae bacterium]